MMTDYPIGRPILEEVYHCHHEVVWAVESYGLLLIRRDTGAQLALSYPEAALWDLLSRELPLERIIKMMAVIEGIGPQSSRMLVAKIISKWEEEGWLTRKGNEHG